MAFPTRDSLQKLWVQMAGQAASVKRRCQEFNAASLSGPVSASAVEEIFTGLGTFRAYMQANAATPGLVDYVRAQYVDGELDIAAEYNALLTQIDAALAWIAASIPQSGGYVQLDQWSATGSVSRRTFSTASLAGLRTVLEAVIGAIE